MKKKKKQNKNLNTILGPYSWLSQSLNAEIQTINMYNVSVTL